MTTTTITEQEQLLIALETTVARGVVATAKRNQLMIEMHQSGVSLQQLANMLNVARRANNVPEITRHGIFKMIHRSR